MKIDREQAELERANFSILRKEAQAITDIVGPFFQFPFIFLIWLSYTSGSMITQLSY